MDLDAARVEYITGKTTYAQIAEKYGVSLTWIGKIAKRDKWQEQKAAYRKTVTEKAVAKLADRGAAQLAKLADAADGFNAVLEKMGKDGSQFNRWITQNGEVILDKTDTRALKAATASLVDMLKVTRDLYGMPNKLDERADKREERRLRLAEQNAGPEDSQVGVVLMPQILPEEPEDAPEVNG